MDLPRSLLIGAIAVLSFMLLTEWVAFKDDRIAATAQETSRLISNSGDAPLAPPPLEVETATSMEDDLPVDPDAPATITAALEVPAADSGRIIQVHTDTLQLAIDLQGGDIIELGLPEYLEKQDNPDVPFVLLEQNDKLTYVAQSGLIGANGIDKGGRATYTTASPRFDLGDSEDTLTVDLNWQDDTGVVITKRFTLSRGDYLVNVEYLVENNSDSRWQANLFGQIKRDSQPPPSADTSGMGMKPFLGVALTQPDERFTKFTFGDMAEEPFKGQLPGGWIAMIQHYFVSAWIPDPEQSHTYSARVTRDGNNIAGFTSPPLVLDPGQSGAIGADFTRALKISIAWKKYLLTWSSVLITAGCGG